jgi:hypothetical protein
MGCSSFAAGPPVGTNPALRPLVDAMDLRLRSADPRRPGRLAEAGVFITVVTGVGLLRIAAATVASALAASGRLSVAHLTTWQGGSFIVLFL